MRGGYDWKIPTRKSLEQANATIAERDRTIVNMQGTINELVRQADALRQQASDAAMEIEGLRARAKSDALEGEDRC